MRRHEVADLLRNRVLRQEQAMEEARNFTTSELIHRLESDLDPPLTPLQLRAYMDEAVGRMAKTERLKGY